MQKERYDRWKIDRLAHIDEIFANTMGWTVQLMNLYEERKRLRLAVSRMDKPDGRDNSTSKQRPHRKNGGRYMGTA